MRLSQETKKALEADIEFEVERREKDRPRRVVIDGIEMDIEVEDLLGGETVIYLPALMYNPGTGKIYKLVEVE